MHSIRSILGAGGAASLYIDGNLIGQDSAGPDITTGVIINPADAQRTFSISSTDLG